MFLSTLKSIILATLLKYINNIFTKAFNNINHKILLVKLVNLGGKKKPFQNPPKIIQLLPVVIAKEHQTKWDNLRLSQGFLTGSARALFWALHFFSFTSITGGIVYFMVGLIYMPATW